MTTKRPQRKPNPVGFLSPSSCSSVPIAPGQNARSSSRCFDVSSCFGPEGPMPRIWTSARFHYQPRPCLFGRRERPDEQRR
eukprot:2911613-Pyramimonas_sp.AAC.1